MRASGGERRRGLGGRERGGQGDGRTDRCEGKRTVDIHDRALL